MITNTLPADAGGITGVSRAGAGLGAMLAAVFLVSFDATVATAAFPALREEFAGASSATLSWTLNAYTLVYAALLVPAGGLADARGRQWAFRRGLLVFTLASLGCGLAGSAGALITARAVQAVGAALLTPAALALALNAAPAERRARVIGLWSATGAFAAAIGPAAGSWLIEAASWRAVFWVNVPIGLLLLARGGGELAAGRESKARGGAVDWPGASLLALGSGMLVWAVVDATTAAARETTLRAAGGAGLLAMCIAWSRGRAGAVLDPGLFRDKTFRRANVATLLFGACFGMMFLSFYLFMTGVWGYGQARAGLAATLGPVMVIGAAAFAGRIAKRFAARHILAAGGLLFAAGQGWYLLRVGAEPDYFGAWLPGQLLGGAGAGLLTPALAGAAITRLPETKLAAGNAVNQAVRQFGLALGVAIAVAVGGSPDASLEDFRVVYALLAVGGLLIAGLTWRLDAPPRPSGAA